jgi:DNA-binding beta-propeller fold protein YncE
MRLVGVTGLNRLQNPVDVAAAADGMLYVADKNRGVVVFDASERFVRVFGLENFQPIGIAVHGDRLYVCDMEAQIVRVIDRRSGALVGSIGSVGDADGQFRLPLGVDTDAEGNVYVVDVMRCRLQKFSPDGAFISGVGEMSDTAGNFVRPKHVAVDVEKIMYVVDAAFQNVQLFDAENRLLTSFGSGGGFRGAMNLPAGICISESGVQYFQDEIHPYFDAQRLIIVTNQFGPDKVSIYALGHLKPGRTVADLAESLAPVAAGTQVDSSVNPMTGVPEEPLEEEGAQDRNQAGDDGDQSP